jgi:hypothetical protein
MRNATRLSSLRHHNRQLLGTYKPLQIQDCIPKAIELDEIKQRRNPALLKIINTILRTPLPALHPAPFVLQLNEMAATKNSDILKKHHYNVQQIITKDHTICTPGAEFRSPDILNELFQHHELWPTAKAIMEQGAQIIFKHQPAEEQRKLENKALIDFHNHRKAQLHPEIVQKSVETDVTYGFAIPFNINDINAIPGAMVCPLGIVEQTTLLPSGERTTKARLTHDQTFTLLDQSESVNKLQEAESYPELIYGFCLRRILAHILSMRKRYPDDRILISKFDIKQAFRRIHYHGDSATKCITVLNNLAILQLRMTFGGANCPAQWCTISEVITDLANEILDTEDWDPHILHWEFQHLVPAPSRFADDIPLEPVLPTLLLLETRPHGSVDVYIDDAIQVILDRPEFIPRGSAAIPLAVDIIS